MDARITYEELVSTPLDNPFIDNSRLSFALLLKDAGRTAEALTWARGAGIATNDVTATAARWAGRAAPDLVEEGLKNITPKQRALYRLEPVITPAAKVADSIQSMFGWMGMSPTVEEFLDQLITWRELGYNYCWQRSDYEDYESLPLRPPVITAIWFSGMRNRCVANRLRHTYGR